MARMLSCLRATLLGFIIILGFSGLILCFGSGVFLYQLHEYTLLTPSGVDGPPISLLGVGLLTIVLAWFVWHFDYSSKSQIISIASLIVIVGVIEIAIGIWAIVRHQQLYMLNDKLVQKATLALNDLTQPSYGKTFTTEEEWHQMHIKLSCCGVNGRHLDFQSKKLGVPWSCCYQKENQDQSICERGCINPMIHRTQSIFLFTFLLALGSVVVKAFIVGVAWCYAKAIKESLEKRKQMIMTNKASALAAAAAAAAASRSSFGECSANLSPLVEKARRPPKF